MFRSVKGRLIAAVLALVVVSDAVVGLAPIVMSARALSDSARDNMETVARNVAIQLDEANSREFRMLTTLA